MLNRTHLLFVIYALSAIAGLPATVHAQASDLRLPISLDADSTDYDGKNSMLMFRGLRLTQGIIGVEADTGRASKLDFEDSVWQFSGNVRIETGNGQIRCDDANLHFAGHELRLASITGSPATFELRRPDSDQVTYAEAGKLEYNFSDGVIEFSDKAMITEGGNQISSNFLVYNIRERRINADSSGNGGEKVKITYTPDSRSDDQPPQEDTPNADAPDDNGDGAQ
ncbi:MAG: LptA/OstA family protein [Woeseia sp.]